jgi:hypothetical protein
MHNEAKTKEMPKSAILMGVDRKVLRIAAIAEYPNHTILRK